MKTVAIFLAAGLIAIAGGCAGDYSAEWELKDEINQLTDQNAQLQRDLEQAKTQNKELAEQVRVLSGLPDGVRGENIYVLDKVSLTKHTNLYDKDGDGTREKLIVYVEPLDTDGDIIKARGKIEVELWDLNRENGQAKLEQWTVKPDELSKLWFNTMMRTNYRLTFDIAEVAKEFKESLTVKVTFTDYLTGKTFKEQYVIEP